MKLSVCKILSLSTVMVLQSCSLPQAVSYNVSHALGVDAPQSAPSIIGEKRKVGNPYSIPNEHGRPIQYTPIPSSEGYRETGIASWYGKDFHAKKTANGEDYNMYSYTAAHKTLPLPTYVRVTNTQNGKSIVVRVNDRGPFYKNRVIDMSYSGAKALGFDKQGTAPVLVEAISIYGGDVNKRNRYNPAPRTQYANKPQNQPTQRYSLTNSRANTASNYQSQSASSSFTTRISNRNNQAAQTNQSASLSPRNTKGIVSANSVKSKYFIQIGSFSDVNNARKVYYKGSNIKGIKIKSIPINGRTYYRVVVEGGNSIQQAQQTLENVKSQGFYNAIIASTK